MFYNIKFGILILLVLLIIILTINYNGHEIKYLWSVFILSCCFYLTYKCENESVNGGGFLSSITSYVSSSLYGDAPKQKIEDENVCNLLREMLQHYTNPYKTDSLRLFTKAFDDYKLDNEGKQILGNKLISLFMEILCRHTNNKTRGAFRIYGVEIYEFISDVVKNCNLYAYSRKEPKKSSHDRYIRKEHNGVDLKIPILGKFYHLIYGISTVNNIDNTYLKFETVGIGSAEDMIHHGVEYINSIITPPDKNSHTESSLPEPALFMLPAGYERLNKELIQKNGLKSYLNTIPGIINKEKMKYIDDIQTGNEIIIINDNKDYEYEKPILEKYYPDGNKYILNIPSICNIEDFTIIDEAKNEDDFAIINKENDEAELVDLDEFDIAKAYGYLNACTKKYFDSYYEINRNKITTNREFKSWLYSVHKMLDYIFKLYYEDVEKITAKDRFMKTFFLHVKPDDENKNIHEEFFDCFWDMLLEDA